jgi:hypothetical protein
MPNATTFLPIGRNPSVKTEFLNSLQRCEKFMGAIAFNTLPLDFWGNSLKKALKKPGSFICFDIHLPTHIGALADMQEQTDAVYLFLFELRTRPRDYVPELSRSLMHTKMMILDQPDGEAHIFIGSHNWTYTAILGPNIEGSLKIVTRIGSQLYDQMASYLEWIKARAEKFDLNLVEYYRMLQKNKDATKEKIKTIKVVFDLEIPLRVNIGFWGTTTQDFEKLGPPGSNIYIQNMRNKKVIELYEGEVVNSGYLPKGNNQAPPVDFNVDLTCFHDRITYPTLRSEKHPEEEQLRRSLFFATVHIKSKVLDVDALYPHMQKSPWKLAPENPFLESGASEQIAEAFGRTTFQVRIPKSLSEIQAESEDTREGEFITKSVIHRKKKDFEEFGDDEE